jgi:hypothetical protein
VSRQPDLRKPGLRKVDHLLGLHYAGLPPARQQPLLAAAISDLLSCNYLNPGLGRSCHSLGREAAPEPHHASAGRAKQARLVGFDFAAVI